MDLMNEFSELSDVVAKSVAFERRSSDVADGNSGSKAKKDRKSSTLERGARALRNSDRRKAIKKRPKTQVVSGIGSAAKPEEGDRPSNEDVNKKDFSKFKPPKRSGLLKEDDKFRNLE